MARFQHLITSGFLILWVLFWALPGVSAQTVTPWSFGRGVSVSGWERMPFLDVADCLSQDGEELRNGLKSLPFSRNISLDLTPANSGAWFDCPQGRIWLLGVEAQGALSLMTVLEDLSLREGVRMYVYNEQKSRVLGPFSGTPPEGVLPLEPLEGERMVLELNIPGTLPSFGRVRLAQVGRVYREVGAMMLKASIDNASPCHIDINCPPAAAWQTDKRAVVRIMVNKGTRTEYGTGVLVNNTLHDGKPYVLTAAHVLGTSEHALRSIFFFDYESVSCGGARGSKSRTVSGSAMVATAKTLDFSLVELFSAPPLMFEPYYAGWDLSGIAPINAVGIHHPWADMKKLAIADHTRAITTTTYSSTDLICEDDVHWHLPAWSQGTTEPGSSGSPLFDGFHRVVGTLSGGASNCSFPYNDYYSKLSEQYNYFSGYDTARLKPWLDPAASGVRLINGFDPVAQALSGCDTLGHIPDDVPFSVYPAGSWGFASGHNSLGTTMFAERFRSAAPCTLYGALFRMAKVSSTGSLSSVQVKVWTGATRPEQEVYSKTLTASHFFRERENLLVFDEPLSITGNYFVGYVISYTFSSDTFAVSQATSPDVGLSTCLVNSGSGWVEQSSAMPSAGFSSLAIRVIGKNLSHLPPISTDVDEILGGDAMLLFPNPAQDVVTACFPGAEAEQQVFCFDMMGRSVPVSVEASHSSISSVGKRCISIRVSSLPPGVYILSVRSKSGRWTERFVKRR